MPLAGLAAVVARAARDRAGRRCWPPRPAAATTARTTSPRSTRRSRPRAPGSPASRGPRSASRARPGWRRAGVTVRCLQRPDGSLPDDPDEKDLVAVVARAY